MQAIPTYFDTVSPDALTHIVHQIKEPTPTLLLSTPLVSVSESLFHTVILDNYCPLRLNVAEATIEHGERDGEDGVLTMDCVEFVLRKTGRFIKKVQIDAEHLEEGSYYAPFIAQLLEHCERVDEMNFRERVHAVDVTQFLTRYGAQLSVLTFSPKINDMPAIHFPCILPKLRVLALFCGSILKICGLWRVAGDTLEEVLLNIWDIDDFNSVVADMRPCCPKLRRLMLFGSSISFVIPRQAHVELLMSYGNQLEEACLDTLGVRELKQLAVHCPNLRCEILEQQGRIERIFAAAPITKRLNVLYSGGDDALFADSLAACKNLNRLYLCHENVDLQSIITGPLSSLEILEISRSPTEEEVEVIARFTTRLKVLDVEFRTMDDASVFEIVARTNGATLEEVRMRHKRDASGQGDVLKWVGELVESFLTRCKRLEYFSVGFWLEAPDKNALGTLLLPLKRRGVRYDLIFNDHKFYSDGWIRRQRWA